MENKEHKNLLKAVQELGRKLDGIEKIITATEDPRVLGIEPIPNINERISEMIKKYRAETIDIEDVTWEESDLELSALFPSEDTKIDTKIDGLID